MAEGLEQVVSGKLRRRAAVLMTGAALGGFYIWMQPAVLGTLEANSAQAADGTGGCVLKVGSTPLTVGGREVRVQSSELCANTSAHLVAPPKPVVEAAEPPADLLRTTIREEVRLPSPAERFAGAAPRAKPEPVELAALGPEPQIKETQSHRDDLEREHLRADAAPEPVDHPSDDRPDNEHEDGGEQGGADNDGGEHSGGDYDRDCNDREIASRDDGGRDWSDRDGSDRNGGEGGEGRWSGGH